MLGGRRALYRAVRDRVTAYRATHDRALLQTPEAVAEAKQLLEKVARARPYTGFPARGLALAAEFYMHLSEPQQTDMELAALDLAVDLVRISHTFPLKDLPQVVAAVLAGDRRPMYPSRDTKSVTRVSEIRARFRDVEISLENVDAFGTELAPAVTQLSPLAFDWPEIRTGLVNLRLTRFSLVREREDLDLTVEMARETAELARAHPMYVRLLISLAEHLHLRYRLFMEVKDLVEGDKVVQLALSVSERQGPRFADLCEVAARYSLDLYERGCDIADLDRSLEHARAAAATSLFLDRLPRMCAYVETALYRFECTGDLADLDKAVEAAELAVGLEEVPEEHAMQAHWTLCKALAQRFSSTGREDDGLRAVAMGEAAVRLSGPENSAVAHEGLGSALMVRHERSGSLDDLEASIAAYRADVEASRDDPAALGFLGNALRVKYEHTGTPQALDEAIATTRRALEADPDESLHRSALAVMLRFRHRRDGSLTDLSDAVDLGEQVLTMGAAQPPLWYRPHLYELGIAHLEYFKRTHTPEHLERSIDLLERAQSLTPATHPRRARVLSGLLEALTVFHQTADASTDFARAVEVGEEALTLTEGYEQNLVRVLLGNIYRIHYGESGPPDSHHRAISLLNEALDAFHVDDARRAMALAALGMTRAKHAARTRDIDSARLALAQLKEVTETEAAPMLLRIDAAHNLAYLAADLGLPAQALDGYTLAVTLMPMLAWEGLDPADQESWLAGRGSLPLEAAAWALECATPERALELLESGRAVQLSRAAGHEAPDLDRLRSTAPTLAESLLSTRKALTTLWDQETATSSLGLSPRGRTA